MNPKQEKHKVNILGHIMAKLLKTNIMKKIIKNSWWRHILHVGARIQIITDFSPKPVKANKVVKEYNEDDKEEKEEVKLIILEYYSY